MTKVSERLLQHPDLTLENQFKLDKVQNKHKDIKMPFALKIKIKDKQQKICGDGNNTHLNIAQESTGSVISLVIVEITNKNTPLFRSQRSKWNNKN